MFDNGITKFIDEDGRAIVYGTVAADVMNDDFYTDGILLSHRAPLLAEAMANNGVHVVAGIGADKVTGTIKGDVLEGGLGFDTLVGGDGVDELYGGAGSDVLVTGNIDGVNAAGAGSEVMEGGAGSDYLVVTGAVGSTVTIGKGDAEDRLLVHTNLLGLPDSGGGNIGMLVLLGGIYEATPYDLDGVQLLQDYNTDSNLFTDAKGEYRVYYYTDKSYNGLEQSLQTLFYASPYVIEYRKYTSGGQLDIRLLGSNEEYTYDFTKTPDDSTRPVLQTITIQNFEDGDYGIKLPDIFLPYGSLNEGFYYGGVPYNFDAAVLEARDAAAKAISDTALSISLTSDGALQGAGLRAAFAATPGIAAENLRIAIDGGAGADVLHGNDVAELIRGQGGDDTLVGSGGDDRYTYLRGDGDDTIDESSVTGGDDRLVLADVDVDAVTVEIVGGDVIVTIAETAAGAGDGGSVMLQASAILSQKQGVEYIQFADGTIWDHDDIVAHSNVNQAPVAGQALADQVFLEDELFSFTLPAGSFTDPNNDTLVYTATLVSDDPLPSWLEFDGATQTFSGQPPHDWNSADHGSVDVKVTASDGSLTVSDIFTLTISPVNDAPVARTVGPVSLLYNVALTYTASALLANATDVDGDQLTISSVGNADHGTVALQPDGSVLLMPDADFIGIASYIYMVSDPSGASSTATVSITVHGVAGQTIVGTAVANTLTGTAGDDTISGLAGNDTLNGNGGVDTLFGGIGNDTYLVDSVGDKTVELVNEGIDIVKASLSWTLAANVENLTLTGIGNHNGTGNDLANTITGNADNNILDGGSGADKLSGGLGDDTYIVDNTTDVTTEAASAGTDTVLASLNWALASNVENLVLTGSADLNGTGNSLANRITGNSGNNMLSGGTGADFLIGEQGNDIYTVDNVGDVVTELAGQGLDTVQSSVSYSLSVNVENLTLTGTASINGAGNALNNVITGNSGNNILDGGLGSDVLIGNIGNDTFVVDSEGDQTIEAVGAGSDIVKSSIDWTLGVNIENLTLTGSTNLAGFGNELNNVLTGNGGNNVLEGGLGADRLIGGLGDDTYVVEDAADVTTEAANAGNDTVFSVVYWSLATNVENLILTGAADLNGTGNSLSNMMTGNGGNNIINGGTGADLLMGGLGNDTYIVDNLGDTITELGGQGIDQVQSSITWTLGTDLENLTLTGTGAINGTGNDLDNVIVGGAGANKLFGGVGNDSLSGGLGNDTLTGGIGNDSFQFASGFGRDIIADFQAGLGVADTIQLALGATFDTFAEVMAVATQVGANTLITIDSLNTITLTAVNKTALVADDFMFA